MRRSAGVPVEAPGRRGLRPDIRIVMGRPSFGNAIIDLHRLATGTGQPIDKIKKRAMGFRKIGHFRRPVIHFRIDVQRIVTAPGRLHQLVPDPLQIEGLRTRPGAGDHQVSPVLKVKCLQAMIISDAVLTGEAPVGGHFFITAVHR